MYKLLIVVALCFPGLAQAAEPKRSSQEVWNELFAKREGREYQFNKFLAETIKGKRPGMALDIGMGATRCFSRRSAGRSPASIFRMSASSRRARPPTSAG